MMRVVAFGEHAFLVDLGLDASADRAARTRAVGDALCGSLAGVEVTIGAGSLLIRHVSPDPAGDRAPGGATTWGDLLACRAAAALDAPLAPPGGRVDEVAVVYDGPDLEAVAGASGLRVADVIAAHTAPTYEVEFVGFLPGFAYLGPIDERLRVPRRASPRPRVGARSVGVAGAYTGVYPVASPGGWSLIGRAVGASFFDPSREPPARLHAGGRVHFVAVDGARDDESIVTAPRAKRGPALSVVTTCPDVTVQDAGRPGRAGDGVPASGPRDIDAFDAANEAVGNPPGAACLEVPNGALTLRASGRTFVSIDGEEPRDLVDQDLFTVPPCARAVRYLGVAGGFDVPVVLGSRATLGAAGFGGYGGRALRRGDEIGVGPHAARARATRRHATPENPPALARLRVTPGPHLASFSRNAFEAFLSAIWRVSTLADRVGVRLEGAPVVEHELRSMPPCPMLRGAVQVASDGTPIVLGPDHPTTGGYPVLAVVDAAGQALLARLRAGHEVRFFAD